MKLINYFYDVSRVDKGNRFELIEDRSQYMSIYYSRKFKKEISEINLEGRTALLYAVGVSIHQSEYRIDNSEPIGKLVTEHGNIAIKMLTSHMAYKYSKLLSKKNNITFMDINSNTCASSMYSIWQAERLLRDNVVDNVVIVSEEKTNSMTLKTFEQSGVNVKVGEGFAMAVFSKTGSQIDITDTKWTMHYDNNPFKVVADGYRKVYTDCDIVKTHGTRTKVNDEAEDEAFGHKPMIGYKSEIGHTQGASALIELCMAVEDKNAKGKVLCVASGLGNMYGSCILHK